MRKQAALALVLLAIVGSLPVTADDEVQALVVSLGGRVAEDGQPVHVAVPDLSGFLSEAGFESTTDLARANPEKLAGDLRNLGVMEVERARESRISLERRYRTLPLGKVHKDAPFTLGQVLALGAEEMTGERLTTTVLERVIKIGTEKAPQPSRW